RLGRYLGWQTNNHAEYQGLILGLERALELGAREVEVYADSELMVRQLLGEYRVRAEGLLPLWRRARELLARFDRARIAHVRLGRAVARGARAVEGYADGERMGRQLRGEYRVRAEGLLPLWRRARELLARFDRARIAHVPRERNAEADEMSNRAIDERM